MNNTSFTIDSDEKFTVKNGTRNFINLDIPDVYFNKDDESTWIIDRKYGVLTLGYCYLGKEDKKTVLKFLVNSAVKFYKWSYTWETNLYFQHNLQEDVEKFLGEFYKNAFMEDWHDEVKDLGFDKMIKNIK